MEKKTLLQLKAFLLANLSGDDPDGYVAAMEQISMLHPDKWKGKLPAVGRFKPDLSVCKVVESTAKRPIIPWWWYLSQKEPVPEVVRDIYKQLVFDYVLVFPKKSVWIYVLVEPPKKVLDLLKNQNNLRAFIMMSILNKNFAQKEREAKRFRMGKLLQTPEINKIFTFLIYSQDYELADKLPKEIPSVCHIVDSSGTSWKITYPGRKQVFWSFKELLGTLSGSPVQVKGGRA
jgi:hypothetical protein